MVIKMFQLQDMAKQGQHNKKLILSERLPDFISEPCTLDVAYQVEAKDNFHLIHLKVEGELLITCQRCMQEFNHHYKNETVIAVVRNDERAEQLLELYECFVSSNGEVNLNDLVIDELHLYAPQFHDEISDCDVVVNEILMGKIEAY